MRNNSSKLKDIVEEQCLFFELKTANIIYEEMKQVVQDNLNSDLGIQQRIRRSVEAEGAVTKLFYLRVLELDRKWDG